MWVAPRFPVSEKTSTAQPAHAVPPIDAAETAEIRGRSKWFAISPPAFSVMLFALSVVGPEDRVQTRPSAVGHDPVPHHERIVGTRNR